MSAPQFKPLYTVDKYLALERASEERHVYLDGEIFLMAGENNEHADISANVFGLIFGQLRGTSCRARTKDTKVRSGPSPTQHRQTSGLYSYPDVVVVCGEPEYHDAFTDVLLNPKVIAEVLSSSTEAFDRGEKFARYKKWNPSLSDYLLVSQDQPRVEHHVLQSDGTWSQQTYTGLEQIVRIPAVGCTLKLADMYDRITFPES